jgi:hypothetical protein
MIGRVSGRMEALVAPVTGSVLGRMRAARTRAARPPAAGSGTLLGVRWEASKHSCACSLL